jgi:amidohydrolase
VSAPGAPDLRAALEKLAPELDALSRRIHAHPEPGFAEVQAAGWLADYLERHGFALERPVGGVATAFRATLGGARGPTVALLAEYDALPAIGHGCGHHLIAAAAAGAGALLAATAGASLPGRVQVIGTPAEEGGGGKIALLEAGVFAGVDAALMIHPFSRTRMHEDLLGRSKLVVEFLGRAAHAAAYPDLGVNALDAMLLHFQHVAQLRQQLRPDARIHGVITHGGDAPNVIPARTAALFYVRALERDYLGEVVQRFEACALGAGRATGSEARVTPEAFRYEPMCTNPVLADCFREHLRAMGVEEDLPPPRPALASSDAGNVSQALPTLHAWIGGLEPGRPDVPLHTAEFRDVAATEFAMARMHAAAGALALTALEVLREPGCLAAVRAAHGAPRG